MTRFTTIVGIACLFFVAAATHAQELDIVTRVDAPARIAGNATSVAFSNSARAPSDGLPDHDPLDRDEFLGQVSSGYLEGSFSERIDPFSGTLHINMVDVVLPGNGGLDIVIQRYYSSNVVNRVDNEQLARHAASADLSGRLGDNGWQLHMGKLMNPFPGLDSHTTLIMPDGSTHALYNRDGFPGQKISQNGWRYSLNGSVHTVTLTNGLKYLFDSAAEGAQYTYMGMDGEFPIQVIQATRIEDLNGNAIEVEYSRFQGFEGAAAEYATLIERVSFDDPDDNRAVVFTYPEESWLLVQIDVTEGVGVVQSWTYHYGAPEEDVLQIQFRDDLYRRVKSLIGVTPPEGNPWSFGYYELSEAWDAGRWLMKTIESPRRSRIDYTWTPVDFATGAQSCVETPEFMAVQSRTTSFRTGIGDIYEDEATANYTYTDGGQEGATTVVVTTDSETGVVLAKAEHVFHGWGDYVFFDTDLWKVGLTESSTLMTMGDLGEPLETVTTTNIWGQGDAISQDTRKTSGWVACEGMRWLSPVAYIRPNSVTRVVERHDSVPDPPPPEPDPASYTTVSTNFDNWGNVGLVAEWSDDGLSRSTALTYWQDEATNIMVGRVLGRDSDPGGTECRQYDALGQLSSTYTNPTTDDVSVCGLTDPVAGARRVDFSYDDVGNMETQIEHSVPSDRVTTYERYKYGSPQDTFVATGDGDNIHHCRDYGPLGTVSWETDGRGCDQAYRTAYDYDTLGRLVTVDPPLSESTAFAYHGDWTQVIVTRDTQQFVYGFDRFGNLTDVFNEQTGHWTQITNDALGRRRQVDLLWNPEPGDTLTYDPLGRLTAVIHPDDPSTRITYDYAGSVVSVLDENLHQTTYHYQAFGTPSDRRLAHLVDAANKTTSYGYDPDFGQLETVTAPIARGDRSFSYYSGSTGCANGLLASETHPESGTTTYEYDCLGNTIKRTRPGPEITTYGFDAAGRLTEILYPDMAGTVTMDYDGASRRTLLENSWATIESTYDDSGRLETTIQSIAGGPQGRVTAYSYDSFDRLETITYPSGRIVTHGWDDRNWLTSLTGEDGTGVEYLPSISYHDSGMPQYVTYGNGITTRNWKDDRNRLIGITSPGLMQIGIVYDDSSNVTDWNDLYNPIKTRSFGYDELDRLTTAIAPGMWGELSFAYDDLGNRETRTLNNDTTTYTYDSSTNRLETLTGEDEGEFLYDGFGRLIEETRGPGPEVFSDGFESGTIDAWGDQGGDSATVSTETITYTFTAADTLTRIERGGQPLGDYEYDGDGLRVSKTVDGETVYYLRTPSGNTLAEYDQDSNPIAEYIYTGDRQVAKAVPDGQGGEDISFFHPDHLGTSLHITDEQGNITWSGDYYPFGAEHSSTGTPDRYRFTQHELDPATSLTYAKARYYHPQIGRFISTDPVGGSTTSSQSWNRYAYVENRPLVATDPTGQWFESAFDIAMAAISIRQAWKNPSLGNIAGAALDVGAVVLPVVPAFGGRMIDAAQTSNKVKKAQSVGESAQRTDNLRRPYKRKAFREQVESVAPRTNEGLPIDPNTFKPIEQKPHFGHKYGKEHRRLVKEAESRGMSQKDFNDWVNDHPDWFQLEDPVSNMSHRFEKPGK
jgi:RHS repeat-associated protein